MLMKSTIKMLAVLLLVGTISCKKDKNPEPEPQPEPAAPTQQFGSLAITFESVVDTLPLVFAKNFVNANGDTFQVTKFNYIISNIMMKNTNNGDFGEVRGYHIIRHSSAGSNTFTLSNVPVGSYKSITFTLGIDSITNASGAKTGELDLAKSGDMYWDWATGYIALKVEGSSPQSGNSSKSITFHCGGYGGVNKAQRVINIDFGTVTADVKVNATPLVHLAADVNEIFKTPNLIKFSTQYYQMSPGPNTKVFADNYSDMFRFKHVHN